MQPVYVFTFKDGETIPNHVLGPQDIEMTIKDASNASGAKIDGNRVSNGSRTMKVRMPSTEAETEFRLRAPIALAYVE